MVAMLVAVAGMHTDVYQVNARGLGHEHAQPWQIGRASCRERV